MAIKNLEFYSNFYLLNFTSFLAPFSVIIFSKLISIFSQVFLFNYQLMNLSIFSKPP